jgi:pyridoxamine 5'-phosphate oxidase
MKFNRQSTSNIRNKFTGQGIDENDMASNPIMQFRKWYDEALKYEVYEPDAMHLATATPDGIPSGRMVLLKGFDKKGFVFFTNYESRKAYELKKNNSAALTFYWPELYRQVRIEGKVNKINVKDSDIYFQARPRGSQISADASAQSHVVESRVELEKMAYEIEQKYLDKPIPRPINWGGFCLSAEVVEFWQGRDNRLHDRIQYKLEQDNGWLIQRLYP